MDIATVLTILSVISALISIAKDAPTVIAEAKSLAAKIEPHVHAANDESVKTAFADAQAKLRSGDFDFSEPAPAGQDAPNIAP